MISEMHSAWHTHRALKGADAVTAEDVVHWATAGGARVLGLPQLGTLAPGQQADIAVFDLSEPRHFGMHDPLIAPVTCAGSAHLRYLMIGGRIVVENGAIPGLDIQKLRSDAARVVARLAA
jgi:8-oxoguanine deaminase